MPVYYNENDAQIADWLTALIRTGELPDGEVDRRSIVDVSGADLRGFAQCHFFAGIGGWPYALRLAGWPETRAVWTGSCPCQPFSASGYGDGSGDSRDLWPAWFQLIVECRPVVVFGEQVASADGLGWFDRVSSNLENENYAVASADLCAACVGAPHRRPRLFFVAARSMGDADRERLERLSGHVADGDESRWQHTPPTGSAASAGPARDVWADADWLQCRDGKARPVEPGTFPLADGIPARVGRLRGYGNAIVPQVGALFVKAYMELEP
jgi:DNA (cytosine-5)-methyltransferase 1